jgi:hypothetical protein
MTATQSEPKSASILSGRRSDDRALRTRSRRSGLLAFAALMIVGSAVGVAVLVNHAGATHEVLVARTSIAEGHTITRDDLASTRVAGVDQTFSFDDAASLIGSTALVRIVPRQVITEQMVADSPLPAAGKSMVGLNLDPARAPSAGLDPGDHVMVVAVADGENGATPEDLDAPVLLASDAQVFDIAGSATEGGGVLVTLVVRETDAARVAGYSAAGRVAIAETAAADGGDS